MIPPDSLNEGDSEIAAPEGENTERELEELMGRFRHAWKGALARVRSTTYRIDDREIEQEVRIRLWKVLQDRREIRSPESYIYRIAVNAALDVIRRSQRRREEPMEVIEQQGAHDSRNPKPSLELAAEQRQTLVKVERALAELSEDRASCVRFYLQGFTSQEIADLKNWTEARARNLTYRGLHQLRKLLQLQGVHYEP